MEGIEPSSQAWEAHILPLNHTRKFLFPGIDEDVCIANYWPRPDSDVLGNSGRGPACISRHGDGIRISCIQSYRVNICGTEGITETQGVGAALPVFPGGGL